MRLTLIHNPQAGDESHSAEALRQMLADAGYEVSYTSTKKAWKKALKRPAELVVAAGGDGTVRKVALELAHTMTPIAVLSLGTANNVGKTVRAVGDARERSRDWADARPRPFDLGIGEAPWGSDRFLESVGGGIFAAVMLRGHEIEQPSNILGGEADRAVHLLAETAREAKALRWRVVVDGRDVSGDYLTVEVQNIPFAGPNVPIAPDADPGDGRLDVVLIGAAQRKALLAYFDARMHAKAAKAPKLPIQRGRVIELVPPPDVPLHLDDRAWPSEDGAREEGPIRITVDPGALRMIFGKR
jgi:diacylglycerol kinase family enzyme